MVRRSRPGLSGNRLSGLNAGLHLQIAEHRIAPRIGHRLLRRISLKGDQPA
jgi:hypothetical protein